MTEPLPLLPPEVVDAINQVPIDVATLNSDLLKLAQATAAVSVALSDRITALEAAVFPPTVPPLPDIDTIHIGASIGTADTSLCWTSVQNQDHSPKTAAILADCGHGNNTHTLGFGADVELQTVEGGPYNWTYLDKIFGNPDTGAPGYFPPGKLKILTLCGCPRYMRVAKPGTAPMPMGPPDMGEYVFEPPHWSHHGNFAKMGAAAAARYGIDILQWWNEAKRYWIPTTPYAGSVLVPPNSGLPVASTAGNRWAIEHMTDCFNQMFPAVRKASPKTKMAGPYLVAQTITSDTNSNAANDAFPFDLHGPWGNADKQAMSPLMYFLEHCVGLDAICLDVKTSSTDANILPEYEWDGLAKVADWKAWIRKLAASDPAKYRRPVADCATLPLHFAEAYSRIIGGLTPTNHDEAAAIDAWSYIRHVLPVGDVTGWVRWQPEGQGTIDAAAAHSIGLWYDTGTPNALQPTEAAPVYAGLVKHFPPGTPLFEVDTGNADLAGIASDKVLCLVSRSAAPATITFNRQAVALTPYDVRFVAR